MTTRSTLVGWLFYGGLACCFVVIATYIFLGKDGSTFAWLVGGTASIGFCVLTGAAILLAYPESGYPPFWVWPVFFILSLASVVVPPFGHFDKSSAWMRLAPLCFAVALYSYKRLFVPENKSN